MADVKIPQSDIAEGGLAAISKVSMLLFPFETNSERSFAIATYLCSERAHEDLDFDFDKQLRDAERDFTEKDVARSFVLRPQGARPPFTLEADIIDLASDQRLAPLKSLSRAVVVHYFSSSELKEVGPQKTSETTDNNGLFLSFIYQDSKLTEIKADCSSLD